MDIYEKVGKLEMGIDFIRSKQETIFKEIKHLREDINNVENRSIKNEKDIRNILKTAGIIGGIVGFFVNLILWLFSRLK